MWEPFFTYKEFLQRLVSDLKKQYKNVKIIDDHISLVAAKTEYRILVTDFYKEYEWTQSYELILNNFLDHLQTELADCHQELNYGRFFPCLRKRVEDVLFLSEPFQLDLEIYYVQDLGESFRFIDKNEGYGLNKLKEFAFKNLENIPYKWVKIDPEHTLWSFETMTDYSSTLFLLPSVRKSLEKHLGSEFYIAFSSATSILAGARTALDYDLLNKLLSYDPDFNKISNQIYLYKDGHLSYSDARRNLKIVKGGVQTGGHGSSPFSDATL